MYIYVVFFFLHSLSRRWKTLEFEKPGKRGIVNELLLSVLKHWADCVILIVSREIRRSEQVMEELRKWDDRDKDRGDGVTERRGRKLDKSPIFGASDYTDHIQ